MTRDQFIALMATYETTTRRLDAERDRLKDLFTVDWWCDYVGAYTTVLTHAIELGSGLSDEWIDWFVFENDFGKNAMEAGPKGALLPIKSAGELWDMVKGLPSSSRLSR